MFGLKLWSTNTDLINEAVALVGSDVFQYVELTPIPGTSAVPFRKHDIPYVVHVSTESHGVNIADPSKAAYSRERIRECILWADQLEADHLILHPGFGRPDDALRFLDGLSDRRILVENMPTGRRPRRAHDRLRRGAGSPACREIVSGCAWTSTTRSRRRSAWAGTTGPSSTSFYR